MPKSKTYEEFIDKFKPKLTTDDCATPEPVYDAVLGWVVKDGRAERFWEDNIRKRIATF